MLSPKFVKKQKLKQETKQNLAKTKLFLLSLVFLRFFVFDKVWDIILRKEVNKNSSEEPLKSWFSAQIRFSITVLIDKGHRVKINQDSNALT